MFEPPGPPPGGFTLPISQSRLLWQLDVIGWSKDELVRRLGVSSQKASNWVKGKSLMPNSVAVWLEMLAQTLAANPKPAGWFLDPTISAAKHGRQVAAKEPEEVD
jgi:transcriptional regulator with XRE-family HTH domain